MTQPKAEATRTIQFVLGDSTARDVTQIMQAVDDPDTGGAFWRHSKFTPDGDPDGFIEWIHVPMTLTQLTDDWTTVGYTVTREQKEQAK